MDNLNSVQNQSIMGLLRLSVSLFFLLLLPRLLTFGLFLDGAIYSSIARNMAEGYGSFWAPYYTGGPGYSQFIEHPPLQFKLHSLLYIIFGDHLFVDTLYGLILGLGVLFFIFKIHELFQKKESAWFSIFIFSIIPLTTWTLSNNMLEITMCFFSLLAVYLELYWIEKKIRFAPFLFFLTGGVLTLSILGKNIAGAFPLIVPAVYLFFKDRKETFKGILYSLLILAGMLFFLWFFLKVSNGMDFYEKYTRHQVIGSLSGKLSGESGGFVKRFLGFFAKLILPLITGLGLSFYMKKTFKGKFSPDGILFIILGISSTLPLFLVSKYRSYYTFASLPIWSMAISFIYSNAAESFSKRAEEKFQKIIKPAIISFLLIGVVLMIGGYNKNIRGGEWKSDIFDHPVSLKPRTSFYLCNINREEYTLTAYMQRYFKWSTNDNHSRYFFVDSKYPCNIPPTCEELTPKTNKRYHIYDCKKEN